MVLPLLTPPCEATKPPPLMDSVQPEQVAVRLLNPPPSVTVLLVVRVLRFTLLWLVKLKAFAVGVVVTLQLSDTVPTVTAVFKPVL